MAKVTGPLMSMSASGQIGKAIVFAGWKGINYVRQFVIPSNPQSADQGDVRVIAGGTGRACGKVQALKKFDAQLIALGVVPSGQSKQSYLVKYIMDHYLTSGGQISATLYAAELAALTGHTAYAAFGTSADGLGITEFDLSYAAVAAYNKALGLYLLGKAGIALGMTIAPYTIAIADWTATQVTAHAANFTTAPA
jgi:hypothetical protein